MTYTTRRIFLALFATLFLVAAPLVLLSVNGVRFSFSERRVRLTGVVNITSLPSRAVITVDGTATRRETPARLSLKPGNHTIRLEKRGFLPWTVTIPVYARGSTLLQDVVLIRQSPPVRLLGDTTMETPILAPSGFFLAYATKAMDDRAAIHVIDVRTGKRLKTFNVAASVNDLLWSPTERALLVSTGDPPEGLWSIADLNEGSLVPLPELSGTARDDLAWFPKDDHRLLQRKDRQLFTFFWKEKAEALFSPEATGAIQSFFVRGNVVVAIRTLGENAELVSFDPPGIATRIATLPHPDYQLLFTTKDAAVVNNRTGETTVYVRQGGTTFATTLPLRATAILHAPNGRDVLLRTASEVWLVAGGSQELLRRYTGGVATTGFVRGGLVVVAQQDRLEVIEPAHGVSSEVPFGQGAADKLQLLSIKGSGELLYTASTAQGTALYRQGVR